MGGPIAAMFRGVPFGSGRLYETNDLDEARERCARVFNPHALQVLRSGQRLRASMDHLRLGPLSLNRLTWGADVAVDPDRLGTYYLLSMPARGHACFVHGGEAVQVTPRCAGLVSAAQRFHFEANADFEQIVVRLERAAVEAGWLALTGAPAERPIDFACAVPLDAPAWRALEPALAMLAASARGEVDLDRMRHLGARLEDLLVTTLLLHQPHALSAVRQPAARPASAHRRRAEAYMLEHLDEPLTLGGVALASGVARRTLQAAFADAHGIGPMQWLRRQRLDAVRHALIEEAGEPCTTVSQTALRFGFTHLGEFGTAYRRSFGETPGATLARRR